MIGLSKKISAAVLSAAVVLTSFLPSEAMPLAAAPKVIQQQEQASSIQDVQYRRYYPRRGPGWYGGYRGYPYYRNGYRHYNGYWYPLAAFGAGAIIGGAIASQPRYYAPPPRYAAPRLTAAHVSWCENRYRSYRAYDNTFQPYNGPRQQCYSPY
ncbi:BA14K family protein [Rhizobium sp. BE258]|jgi:hypothetical protein|uniref:BA14K family protein n=1 Tax=Rhizobium sp. BE258 TaxID=2817722 RepID=UPI00285F6242|nr:BA14K family protein [Rhizobium sp. BE258]MDR7143140.1 hypothetical protein [Rhizobium sp. BE258]